MVSNLLCYAKRKPDGKFLENSILHGPYVRRIIVEPGNPDRTPPVPESTHEQTDDELTTTEAKQPEADDQAIQIILIGSNIGVQEKEEKLLNVLERFKSIEGESIESYYHRFAKLMNDLDRNKHTPHKIASNLKFLNHLQPEWKQYVTLVHQMKNLHEVDYNQLYDFLKMNQEETNANGWSAECMESGWAELSSRSGYSDGNQNRLIVFSGIANQNGNGNVVATQADENGNRNNVN
ncbi:hypothetical protein Tco_0698698 [Tanacetum coccineum]